MSRSKPVFVLLHGAWHTPLCWTRLTPLLNSAGFETHAPQLPSSVVGSNAPITSRAPDIAVIRDLVTRLAETEGKDIIVVAHSNAGTTAGTSLDGLSKKECLEKGWEGGVVRLVYICAFLVPEGFAQFSKDDASQGVSPEMKLDFEKGVSTVEGVEDVKSLMYQDLSDEEVAEVARTLVPMSIRPNYEPVSTIRISLHLSVLFGVGGRGWNENDVSMSTVCTAKTEVSQCWLTPATDRVCGLATH